jgi:hypothetical protein
MIVAIGPVANLPSWQWVGLDAVNELSKYFHVELFNSFKTIPGASVVIVVKKLPPASFIEQAREKRKKIIYIPIDHFDSEIHINANANILRNCTYILSHAESLVYYFKKHSASYLIEHPSKYSLDKMEKWKPQGFVLWIGGYQFVPYLYKWLLKFPIDLELVLCTDYNNKSAQARAEGIANSLGVSLKGTKCKMCEWSEETQASLMKEAKAAIDIKGDDFSQMHKPPTKAQQCIASGIPFAINDGNNCYCYFKNRGFNVATPNDMQRWFSESYWQETSRFGKLLKKYTSSKEIGLGLKKCIDNIMNPSQAENPTGLMISRF